MPVRLAPTQTTNFDVTARTLADVVAILSQRDEAGHCHWSLSFHYDSTDRHGHPVGLVIEGTVTIEMPNWVGYDSATAAEKAEWTRFYHALRDHEDGHDSRMRVGADAMERVMRGTPVARLKRTFQHQRAAIQHQNNAYDAATDHGRKPPPGTIITVP